MIEIDELQKKKSEDIPQLVIERRIWELLWAPNAHGAAVQ